MIVNAIQYSTIEAAEIGQNNILLWLKEQVPGLQGERYADPYLYEGNVYIILEDNVLNCPECANFIELEIIQEYGF